METKISVVIPTYRRPALLKKCLVKLSRQTFHFADYEIIVVSDGPDNLTGAIVAEFQNNLSPTIILLSLPAKKGPAAARNCGWQNAKGFLIAFTDDDCLPAENWLESIWRHYKSEAEVVFAGRVIVPVSNNPTDFELNTKGLETGEFVTANCICTKAALHAAGGFDEAFSSAWREDSDLHFKLIKLEIPIVKLNEAVVVHPVRKAPWGISILEQKKTLFNALLYKKHPDLYRQRIKSHPTWRYYLILLFFVVLSVALVFKFKIISLVACTGWLVLTVAFIVKRLSVSKKTASHVFEMIVTSAVIPFLSIYWTLYGAKKYRVLFF
jgi:glycosyltransferase involved in cell wall biosynthesis